MRSAHKKAHKKGAHRAKSIFNQLVAPLLQIELCQGTAPKASATELRAVQVHSFLQMVFVWCVGPRERAFCVD